MSRDLRSEVAAFLDKQGPATVKAIASGVRARRDDVAAVLAQEGFSQAPRPEGAHPHSVWFLVSRRVPRITEGSRAGTLLGILRDGAWHTRADIFERAGRSFLTNNAASDLRAAGHDVRFDRKRGYRLVSLAAPEGTGSGLMQPSSSGAASETRERAAA